MTEPDSLPSNQAADGASAGATDGTIEPSAAPDRAPPRRRRRSWPWTVAQLTITGGLLAWIFHDAALRAQMADALRRAEVGWLLLGVLMGAIWLAAAVYRWHIFLRVQEVRFELWRSGCVYLIAMFFTLFLPGAVSSDAVRIVYLFRERPRQKAAGLLSIMMDRLAGLLAMTATAVVIAYARADWLAQSPITEGLMRALVIFLVGSVVGLVIALLMTQTGLVHRVPKWMPWRKSMIDFALAFGLFLRHWRWSLCGVGVSFVTLYAYFATFYCAGRAFGASASLLDIFSIMPIVDAITALPITVSGLGVRETLFETMLRTLAHVPSELALLISLGGFGMSVVWFLLGGIVFPLYRPSTHQPRQAMGELVRDAKDV